MPKLNECEPRSALPRSTGQVIAPERSEAGHVARLRFSFNWFASF